MEKARSASHDPVPSPPEMCEWCHRLQSDCDALREQYSNEGCVNACRLPMRAARCRLVLMVHVEPLARCHGSSLKNRPG